MIVDTIGATNANSYADLAYASAYFVSRLGAKSWDDAAEVSRESALIHATTLMDKMFDWVGDKYSKEQSLRWPRSNAYDIDDYLIDYTIIPVDIKKAQCELALSFIENSGYSGESRGIDRMRIGSIMMDFDGAASSLPIPQVVIDLLKGLGNYRGSGKSGSINSPLVRV